MLHRTLAVAVTVALTAYAAPLAAQQHGGAFVTRPASALEWSPIQPPGFDAGMEIAVVHGDPAAAGQPYVVRLRFSDGYRFPPHYHPVAENVTVIEGTFLLAMGEKTNESMLARYQPGDYLFIDARHPHFGGAMGRTVIQLHGQGPFEIIVVGSPEDRRGNSP